MPAKINALNVLNTKKQVFVKISPDSKFCPSVEIPFGVGLGLYIHTETQSNKLIDCRSDLGLTVSDDKVVKIQTEVGNSVAKTIGDNDGVYVPPNTAKRNSRPFCY